MSLYRWRADYRNLAGERCTAYSPTFDFDAPALGDERARYYREDLLATITRKANTKLADEAQLAIVVDLFS